MVAEVTHAVKEVENQARLKALVIRGEGRGFCAGADLDFLGRAFDDYQLFISYLKDLNAFFFQLEELALPVIGLVHGFALAGGLELLLACNMVIAAEDARIGDQHANYGLMPGGGATQAGAPKDHGASAHRALAFRQGSRGVGPVMRAVPLDSLDNELEKLLVTLRDKRRVGLGWIKSTALRGQNMALRDGVAFEIQAFAQYVASSSHPGQGIQAFKERRQPKF